MSTKHKINAAQVFSNTMMGENIGTNDCRKSLAGNEIYGTYWNFKKVAIELALQTSSRDRGILDG